MYFEDIRLYKEYPPPQHTAKVDYDGYPEYIKEPRWHVWNIPLAEFNDVNLGNVAKIAIGFGDGNSPGGEPNGKGTVYFEDIILRNGPAEDIYYDGSVYLEDDPFENGYLGYPLLLKQDCRLIDGGGEYIDELRNLVGKTTAWEGFPDYNVADIGFHYFNWYYVNTGDGNTLEADLNQDDAVNLKDFAILADGWQETYDINDLQIMADKWLHLAGPNIQLQIVGDGNNGFVHFGATGYTDNTKRIFLFVDGQYTREIFEFEEGYTLDVDVSEYGGGEKQLKAVSIDNDGQVTCSNITITEFNCPLNYCFLPSSYEPNKPLYFSAFNPADGNVSVNVYADCGNLVWSQDYNGVSLSDYIPAEITSQHEIDYVSFDKSGVGSVLKTSDADPKESPSSVKALIIITTLERIAFGFDSVWRVQAAFKERGIKYAKLSRKNATYAKIKKYANNIKYMYIFAHGNYRFKLFPGTWVLRTRVQLYDGPVVSVRKSDLIPSECPSWCEDLDVWEDNVKSFFLMGFNNLKFAYFDCCYSGRLVINEHDQLVEGQRGQIGLPFYEDLRSDMSWALGMHESVFETKAYEGWYDESWSKLIPIPCWPFSHDYEMWTRDMWERLGAGDTLGMAELIASVRQTNWSDPNAPVNCERFKGQGDIINIRLE